MIALLAILAAHAEEPPRVTASLLRAKVDGQRWVGVHYAIADGWHIYWENPGQSGLATSAALTGATAVGPVFPGPDRFVLAGGIVNNGYEHEATLLFRIDDGGKPDVHVSTAWLVCHDECVPGSAELGTSLEKIPRSERSAVKAALARVPVVATEPVAVAPGTSVDVFPSLAFEASGAVASAEIAEGKVWLTVTPSDALAVGPVVLRLAGPDGLRYVQMGLPSRPENSR